MGEKKERPLEPNRYAIPHNTDPGTRWVDIFQTIMCQ